MLSSVLSVPTVMICIAITVLIVAMALTLLWLYDRRESAAGWWALGMWSATIATVMLATRTILPHWFALGFGNSFLALAFAMVSAGFTVFAGRKPDMLVVAIGPLLWVGCYAGSEVFRDTVTFRIVLLTMVMGGYSALVAYNAWRGWKAERLPTYLAVIAIYGAHALLYAVRIPFAIASPATERGGDIQGTWVAAFALEGFALTILSTLVFVALIKERTERRYRLAAEIDSLTSAATRRHFVSQTRRLLGKKPEKGVLAVMDLDFFKSINDTYGHIAGDRVLQAFGAHVASRLAPGMLFGRLGGEEFGLFMPAVTEPEAQVFLDKLRTEIAALEIPFMGHSLKITISIGAALSRDTGPDFDHLMAGADNALYVAKDTGRNRVQIFTLAIRMRKIVEAGLESRIGLSGARVSRIAVRSRASRG